MTKRENAEKELERLDIIDEMRELLEIYTSGKYLDETENGNGVKEVLNNIPIRTSSFLARTYVVIGRLLDYEPRP